MSEKLKEEFTYIPPENKDVRWLFDYSFFIMELRAKLMGGMLEQYGNKLKFIKLSEPLMNETGIDQTIALVNGFVYQIQALSVLNEERVFEICKDLAISLAKFYYKNMDNFNLTPEKASVIIRLIMVLFETNLRKSIGAKALMMIGQSERVSIVEKEQEKKKFLGVI